MPQHTTLERLKNRVSSLPGEFQNARNDLFDVALFQGLGRKLTRGDEPGMSRPIQDPRNPGSAQPFVNPPAPGGSLSEMAGQGIEDLIRRLLGDQVANRMF